ncbi:MAG: putative rane protein [Verrucomicrobiales bacterium]|nr:putative rane protein [Verrucomicrobiales bacterium]
MESGKKLPPMSGAGKKLPFAWFFAAGANPSAGIRPRHLLLLLCGFFFASFPGVVMGFDSLFYRDFGIFGAPLASYHRQAFWQGQLPLWNPLNNCGLPFAAQWNSMVFYPFSLVYLLLPFPWSLNVFCLGHAAMAGLAMYWLAEWWLGRRNSFGAAVAGLAFAWNGFTLHALMWPNNIAAFAWMPLVILAVQKGVAKGGKSLFCAALCGAVQMLTGAPEIIAFTWGAAFLFLFIRPPAEESSESQPACMVGFKFKAEGYRTLRRFSVVFALVLGLCAIQLLPFLELVGLSQRSRNFGDNSWSLPAWGLANFLVPLFRSTPSRLNVYSQDEQQWTSSYYVGIGVILFALIALWKQRDGRARLLGCMLLGSVWLAFGRDGWLYELVNRVIPVLGFIRFPVKFIVLALFALSLLAGQGADWVFDQERESPKRTVTRIGLLLSASCVAILLIAFLYPFPQDSWAATWKSGLSRIGFLLTLATGLLLRTRAKTHACSALACGLLLCMGLDVLTHAPSQNPVVPVASYKPAEQSAISTGSKQSRVMLAPAFKAFMSSASTESPLENWKGLRAGRYSDCNLLDGVWKTDGFFSLYLKEEALLRDRLEHASQFASLPMLDFIGVEMISAPDVLFAWQKRSQFSPFVTAGQVPVFASPDEALDRVTSSTFRPANEVYLPADARLAQGMDWSSSARIKQLQVGREKIEFETEADKPAWGVIAQAFHPAWRLRIDGQAVPLLKANFAFQAFQIPAGVHHAALVYSDNRLFWGALISLATLILCLLGALFFKGPSIVNLPKLS